MRLYNDFAKRNGSTTNWLSAAVVLIGMIAAILFLISLVGSLIWGNEGFVDLLASFF